MATTKESISNAALSLLKAENRISNLTQDTSLEARLCNQHFDQSLDAVLEMHPWNFSIERATLAKSADTPVYQYDYKYQLPTNPYCLKVLEVVDSDEYEVVDWNILGRYVETDIDGISIKYIKRVSNLTEASSTFIEALTYYLAAKLAEPLLHSSDVVARMERGFRIFFMRAKKSDSQQGIPKGESDSDYAWLEARYS